MKIFKSLALAAGLAFLTVSVSAQAQQGQKMDPTQMAQNQVNHIKQNVTGITPDQESKLLAVEQDYTKSFQDAIAGSNGDHDAVRAKMQPVKESRDAKIKTILTADQYAQYEKMETAHQGGHRGGN